MKAFSTLALAAVLLTATATGAFAAPDRIIDLGETVLPTTWTSQATVPVTDAVKAYFAMYNIRGNLDPAVGPVSSGTASDVETLVSDQLRKDELIDIIKPALAAKLVYGTTESVSMQVGNHIWNLSIRAHS